MTRNISVGAVSILPTSGTMRQSVMPPMCNPFTRSEGKACSQGTEAPLWNNEGSRGVWDHCFSIFILDVPYKNVLISKHTV